MGEGMLKGRERWTVTAKKEQRRREAQTHEEKGYGMDLSLHRFMSGMCLLLKYMCGT